MIGLSAKDLYLVSLYMNEGRVLAEDFYKLCSIKHSSICDFDSIK